MAKLLVVDDEKNLRLVVQKELSRQGHTVGAASDGEEAWELLEAEDFDVVLCDINMPRLDGMGLLLPFVRPKPKSSRGDNAYGTSHGRNRYRGNEAGCIRLSH